MGLGYTRCKHPPIGTPWCLLCTDGLLLVSPASSKTSYLAECGFPMKLSTDEAIKLQDGRFAL